MALCRNGQTDILGSGKETIFLAALATDAGRPVSQDTLIHRLWDDDPPGQPRASLHAYVTRIRRRLRSLDADGLLVQRTRTYTLDLDPGRIDCHRFQELTARARAADDHGDEERALSLLREAEDLWRGEPLAGLPGLWAEHVRGVLGERRLSAHLVRCGIGLRRGRFAELVPDLTALLDEHPTDEVLAGQLMTAAYGCGRQADALRVYDTVRRRLVEELGADPGPALARLHGLVLDGAPAHALLPRPQSAPPAPDTLPAHAELVGREAELAVLLDNGRALTASSKVIALQTVSGMAGVGKTHLAVRAARLLAPDYPDGRAHLDFRTHTPGQEPLTAEAALTSLLRTFGIPADDLPHDLDGLSALWRAVLGGRRAIVVLDDVADARQLRPLLPGTSPSLVIVTSRRRFTGLPGIRSVELDVLPPADAVALFRAVAGEERSRRTDEVTEIVRLTGYLPLAVELLAGRLASRPTWTTAHLLRKLTRGHGRLREIRHGIRGEIVRAFEVSYHALTIEEQTVFRFLGLRFGPDVDAHVVAALSGISVEAAEDILESLLDSHLIQEPAPERYTLHDLLGEYSRAVVMSEETESARESAIRRLIDFYVHASDAADRLSYPRALRPHRARPVSGHPAPPWPDAASARHWLLAQRAGLVAAERHCRTRGLPRQAALLASALAGFLDDEGCSADAWPLHEAAARYWHAAGDRRSETHALIDLGNALSRCGRYDEARTALVKALDGANTLGDSAAGAEALHQLGVLAWNRGQLSTALDLQSRTLRLRTAAADTWQIARCHNNIGITHIYLGNFESARENFDTALTEFRRSGDLREYGRVLNNLSDLHMKQGDTRSARDALHQALNCLSESESPWEIAITRVNLANTMESPAELESMLALYRESLDTFRRLGDRRNAAETLRATGLALQGAGRSAEAAEHHRRALAEARSVQAAHEEAQALHALGQAEDALGDAGPAAAHISEAIDVADRIGAASEAARARQSLAALRQHLTAHHRAEGGW
ncbi:BTAD domain-containing putative transcriptional regulator [Streptomyces sp. NPDC051016]|uniref:AfsR/SARP family transcriptional regulator n=1 Tax=Streptomyces sp. NPDC051016 TaxID=3365638 RepID=UPI0037B38105